MEKLNKIHRENIGRLLEKQSELQQKQYSILRFLISLKSRLHVTSEIKSHLLLLSFTTTDLTISFLNGGNLTLKFVTSEVTCQKDPDVDCIIHKSLSDPIVYRQQYRDAITDGKDEMIEYIVKSEKVKRFLQPDQLHKHLLVVIKEKTNLEFWSDIGRLNCYFFVNLYNVDGAYPIISEYIEELMYRCCLASSIEVLNELQQFIIHVVEVSSRYMRDMRDDEIGKYIRLFRPIFQVAQLSKTTSLQTILKHVRRETKDIPDLTIGTINKWKSYNPGVWFGMRVLFWIKRYLQISYQEDVTDPALKQMEFVLDHYHMTMTINSRYI